MEMKPALGVEGTLIPLFDGSWVFRVYDKNGDFVDYDIHHSDLWIKITDPDAVLYSDDGGYRLDHHPSTLGKE